jgi:hypothetical protein
VLSAVASANRVIATAALVISIWSAKSSSKSATAAVTSAGAAQESV